MNDLDRLVAIEEIKQLKAKYFLGIDHKDWDLWRREVWAPDAQFQVPELAFVGDGVDAIIKWVSEINADQVTIHHGHMPIIDITSDTTATGLWAMEDVVYCSAEHPLNGDISYVHGFGHYHENYVKLENGWRVHSTRLSRLRTEYLKIAPQHARAT